MMHSKNCLHANITNSNFTNTPTTSLFHSTYSRPHLPIQCWNYSQHDPTLSRVMLGYTGSSSCKIMSKSFHSTFANLTQLFAQLSCIAAYMACNKECTPRPKCSIKWYVVWQLFRFMYNAATSSHILIKNYVSFWIIDIQQQSDFCTKCQSIVSPPGPRTCKFFKNTPHTD